MKHIIAAAAVLVASAATAQEIGSEIPAETPPTSGQTAPATTYDNPYAPPPAAPAPQKTEEPAAAPGRTEPGPRRGAFGLRGGFSGAGAPGAPASPAPGTAAPAGAASPTIGLKFLPTEKLGVNVDFGAATIVGLSTVPFGFGLGLGVDAYLGSPERPIRGVVTGGASFGKLVSTLGDDFFLDFNVGGGAEYWFSDHFSLAGKALVSVPVNLKGTVTVRIASVTPAMTGTFYF